MGIVKRKFANDENGIAPIIWAIVLAGSLIAGIGVYQFTQRPDITYNITDTGFSIAGLEIDSLWVIIIGAMIIFGLMWYFGRKKPK